MQMRGETNWMEVNGFELQSRTRLYVTACYFTVTTITTVGYGDMGPTQTEERLLGIATMIVGIFTFTFATGALTSMISNEDARKG